MHFRCRELSRDDGGVAAEFAVTLPAIVLVVLLAAGAVSAQAERIVLQDAVADASRIVARGESPDVAAAHVARAVPGARMTVEGGEVVCVRAAATVRLIASIAADITASSCALGDGR